MVIEPAAVKDAAEILALQMLAYQSEAEIYGDYGIPPLTQTLDNLIAQFQSSIILKAVEDGRITGSVRGHVADGTGHIERLVVHPDCQGRGTGKQLMHAIETRLENVERYELFTGEKSARNLYLYQKLGYQIFRSERLSDQVVFVYLEKQAVR